MKTFIKYGLAASLAAGAVADHHHRHPHFRRHVGSAVQARKADPVIEYVVGPTETVYELNGKVIAASEAKEGIKGGDFVVVGETTPTYSPPPPPPKPTTSSEAEMGAQFVESKPATTSTSTSTSSSSSTSTSTSTPPPEPTTTSEEPTPEPTTSSVASSAPKPSKPSSPSTGSLAESLAGVNVEFPDGEIDCTEFPSKWGAVPLPWLNTGGWSGIQYIPGFSKSWASISTIHTAISGKGCEPDGMCSYACPDGYQKTQWPKAQGTTKQSIGGLYCNSEGKLELTRSDVSTYLCEKGVGGIFIQNDLDEEVCACRTDYPGTENMVLPTIAKPGSKVEVANPDQTKYYQWNNQGTSAQLYLNKKGYSVEDACVWESKKDPAGAGDRSPAILGTGRAADGNTYIGLFRNKPQDDEWLDFNIEITGDGVQGDCWYKDGKFAGGKDGCTATMSEGGKATIRYY